MAHGEQRTGSGRTGGRVLPFRTPGRAGDLGMVERKGYTASPRTGRAEGAPTARPRATEILVAAQRATQSHVTDATARRETAPRRVPWSVVAVGAVAVAAWLLARRAGAGPRRAAA